MKKLTEIDVVCLENSWKIIAPNIYEFIISYYNAYYAKSPDEIPMFKVDIKKESEKFLYIIGLIVSNLHNLNNVESSIRKVVDDYKRTYKVKKGSFPVMKSCFFYALKKCMRSSHSMACDTAWAALMEELSYVLEDTSHVQRHKFQILSWN